MIAPYSPEWWQARRGKITASRMFRALYGGPGGKNNLLDALEAELADDFVWPPENDAPPLKWGRDHEPKCRELIEIVYDVDVYEPGLMFHKDVPIIGATPDFAITKLYVEGLKPSSRTIAGEIKCPWKLKNHFKHVVGGLAANQDYVCQVQCQMLVMGTDEAWFVSYHPEATAGSKLYREVVEPDRALQDHMLVACVELERMLQSGSRFDNGPGVTRARGIPQLF